MERANRSQSVLDATLLDELIDEDHRARSMWMALEQLDLSKFYESIDSFEGAAGRPAIDPRVLVCLWLYATSEGVGSARRLERLCQRDAAYRWICGGLEPCGHSLSNFRVDHAKALDQLLTQLLAVLMSKGVVELKRVSQDGTKVRASAGAASFRRETSLRKCLDEAQRQVHILKRELDAPAAPLKPRNQAARQRAAQDREARVTAALKELEVVRASTTRGKDPDEARVSTTDPDARVMKMPDGGFRPAVNVQIAVDTESRVIVGVDVVNAGSDQRQLEPMLEKVIERTGKSPQEYLVDGGYTRLETIERAAERGLTVYTPLRKDAANESGRRRREEGEGVRAWRARMESEDGKRIYKERASTVETVNADLRTWRGLQRIPVRGLDKALCIALWSVLAYDVLRALSLGALS